jgi:hypothetical protein
MLSATSPLLLKDEIHSTIMEYQRGILPLLSPSPFSLPPFISPLLSFPFYLPPFLLPVFSCTRCSAVTRRPSGTFLKHRAPWDYKRAAAAPDYGKGKQ